MVFLSRLGLVAVAAAAVAGCSFDTERFTFDGVGGVSSGGGPNGGGPNGGAGGMGGGAGNAGGGGEGGSVSCEPNSTTDCYDGPAGTLDVGICAGGTQTCNADGTGYGPCVGQVLPGAEDCSVTGDEDCNGTSVNTCAGAVSWHHAIIPTGNVSTVGAMTVTQDGSVYLLGYFNSDVDFGPPTTPLSTHGQFTDTMLAKIGPTGQVEWAKQYGDIAAYQFGHGLAAMSDGSVVGAGRFSGTMDFGTGPLTSVGDAQFIARFNPDGTVMWTQQINSDGGLSYAVDVAVDSDDNIYLLSDFESTATLGALVETTVSENDILVAKLNAGGAPQWMKSFGGVGDDFADTIAVAPDDAIIISGTFASSIDFGGAALSAVGASESFLARLDGDGDHVASISFGGVGSELATRVAVAPDGRVYTASTITAPVTVAGNLITPQGSDVLVMRFDDMLGYENHVQYGATGDETVGGLGVDGAGHVLLSGFFSGQMNLNGTPWTANETDYFMAKLDFKSSPNVLWGFSYPTAGIQFAFHATPDPTGGAVFAGVYQNSINFELGNTIDAISAVDVAVVRRGL